MHSSMSTVRRGGILLLMLTVMLLGTAPAALATKAASADPQVLPPQARMYGATYGEWSARWWQWTFRLPLSASVGSAPTHPLFVDGAVDCSYGQSGQVWFLGGTFITNPDPNDADVAVGAATRSCAIPAGTALFFPVLNSEVDMFGLDPNTKVDELWQLVTQLQDGATNLGATIDGRPIGNLDRYRVKSPVFAITMPENNVYGFFDLTAAAGTYYPTVADGVFLMLAPLSVGHHTITVRGATPSFRLDVTYNITVIPHN